MLVATEVCVIGGGPAGACLAIRLARLGHSVSLVAGPNRSRSYEWVSLSPAVAPLSQAVEITLPVEEIGQARVLWELPHDTGRASEMDLSLVERSSLNRTLQQQARAAGANVIPAAAGCPKKSERGWQLSAVFGGEEHLLSARFLVDASGRAAALPGRPHSIAPTTMALTAECDNPGDHAFQHVESCSEGWLWAAATRGAGRLVMTAFVDPKSSEPGRNRKDRLSEMLPGSRLIKERGISPSGLGPILACDATARRHSEVIGEDWMRVGDAALALDPIAGQGVQSAMSGALQAAAVIHTMLHFPEDASVAAEFYRARHQERCLHHEEQIGSLYSAAYLSGQQSAFWRRRARALKQPPPPLSPVALPLDVPLYLSPDIPWTTVPCLQQDRVRSLPALRIADEQRPIAFLGGVALYGLIQSLGGGGTAADLLVRLEQSGLSERLSLEALHWLHQKHLLTVS